MPVSGLVPFCGGVGMTSPPSTRTFGAPVGADLGVAARDRPRRPARLDAEQHGAVGEAAEQRAAERRVVMVTAVVTAVVVAAVVAVVVAALLAVVVAAVLAVVVAAPVVVGGVVREGGGRAGRERDGGERGGEAVGRAWSRELLSGADR